MNISKEYCNSIGIASLSFNNGSKSTLCSLQQVEQQKWTFFTGIPAGFNINDTINLHINFKDNPEDNTDVPVKVIETGYNYCCVKVNDKYESESFNSILKTLNELELIFTHFSRRKEKRIKINSTNYKNLGLEKMEQYIFFEGIKLIQPCVLVDVSIHGVQLLTLYSEELLKHTALFKLKLEFENPKETIILLLHQVQSRVTNTGEKKFLNISCQILEPIHLQWKSRVIKMLQQEE